MSKFSKRLARFDTTGRTIDILIPELGATAAIECLPSNQSNKPYFNAILRYGGKGGGGRKLPKEITVADIRKNRIDEAKIYAQHVVVGFTDIVDDDGNEVECNPSNVEELLIALIDMAPLAFDNIRDRTGEDSEFFLDADEVDELAKN